jgi:hypothetical protein
MAIQRNRHDQRREPRRQYCPATGKRRWPDRKAAQTLLHHAQAVRRCAEDSGACTRRQEVRSYLCPSCRGIHTTSTRQGVAR